MLKPKLLLQQFKQKSIAIGIVFLLIYILYLTVETDFIRKNNKESFSYYSKRNNSEQFTNYIQKGPKIFFIETSESKILNVRQACAVESTARHNPSMSVHLLMTPPSSVDFSQKLMESLLNLPNVFIKAINVSKLLYGTPLWKWYKAGQWRKSQWKASHLSDALRVFMLWRYGGIYLDLDVVSLRSMENLQNTVIAEHSKSIASCILIFDQDHKFLNKTIYDLEEHYNPKDFGCIGPILMTRNVQQYCDINDCIKVSNITCNITILPPLAAFPIFYDKWEEFFKPSQIKNITNYFNSSYIMHLWNYFSKERAINIGENSIYETAMKEHCPVVYDYIA